MPILGLKIDKTLSFGIKLIVSPWVYYSTTFNNTLLLTKLYYILIFKNIKI